MNSCRSVVKWFVCWFEFLCITVVFDCFSEYFCWMSPVSLHFHLKHSIDFLHVMDSCRLNHFHSWRSEMNFRSIVNESVRSPQPERGRDHSCVSVFFIMLLHINTQQISSSVLKLNRREVVWIMLFKSIHHWLHRFISMWRPSSGHTGHMFWWMSCW